MNTWMIVALVVVVIAALGVGLYFWGNKLKKRYEEQQQLINQHKQVVQLFVIDKKRDKLDNLKLPKQIKEQVPKMQRRRKMAVVVAKIGPQIQTLLCDERVYESIPLKKQIKVELAGIMLVDVVSGKLPVAHKPKLRDRVTAKAKELTNKGKN